MELKRKVEYTVIYERGENHWGAYVPDLPGCTSAGTTLDEAKLNVLEAIELWIEVAAERGLEIPLPTTEAASATAEIPDAA